MNDHLHQMNITYSGKEDRLLLRTSTHQGDEYRIWLTRRFTRLLLQVLATEMQKHGGHLSIGSQGETAKLLREGAFDKPYEEEKASNFPLGEDGILAYGVKSHNKPDGRLFLQIHSEAGLHLGLNLSEGLLYMFHNLIVQGIENAEWNIASDPGQNPSQIH